MARAPDIVSSICKPSTLLCFRCEGSGKVDLAFNYYCNGEVMTNKISSHKCSYCDGTGLDADTAER